MTLPAHLCETDCVGRLESEEQIGSTNVGYNMIGRGRVHRFRSRSGTWEDLVNVGLENQNSGRVNQVDDLYSRFQRESAG